MSSLAIEFDNKNLFPITNEAYHLLYKNGLLTDNVELIEGIIFTKMPKNPIHSDIVRKILISLIQKFSDQFLISGENPISLINSEPEPDIAILNLGDYSKQHPREAFLIVEVADSSLQFDRQKASIYAKGNIPEYLIFNIKDEKIEFYSNPKNGMYTEIKIYSKYEKFKSKIIPALELKFQDFLSK